MSSVDEDEAVGTTKEIDVVCKRTFKMGVGSFTAMNLTGGNPITAVGLDNYTTKIGPYFKTPDSLKDKVANKENWDVPARGEKVDGAGGTMADDQDVRAHGIERHGRVDERLALVDR